MKRNNKILHLTFVLFVSAMLSSCETQIGTAMGAAFTNLITGNGFGGSSSDDVYEKMKSDTLNQRSPFFNDKKIFGPDCSNFLSSLIIFNINEVQKISKLKDKMCSCEPWGTCDNMSCSCEKLCPKNFDILNRSKTANDHSADNSLSFTNGDSDFYEKYSDYTGFCWGHAIITQRFNRLAKFNPEQPRTGANDVYVRQRELKSIIAKINNNEPVDIAGYKNLRDFSSDPEVKELLEEAVKKNWARNAMSTQGLHIVASGKPNPIEETKKMFDDIEFRLKHNQMPAVVFNDLNQSSLAHTVLVSGSGATPEGQRYLCIRDNNFSPEKSYNCQNKMMLNPDGSLDYSGWPYRKIGKIELSYTENSNVVEQISNLHSRCLSDKDC